jgi:hypothetical protein
MRSLVWVGGGGMVGQVMALLPACPPNKKPDSMSRASAVDGGGTYGSSE